MHGHRTAQNFQQLGINRWWGTHLSTSFISMTLMRGV
jgi:hypothetical protein